MENAGVSGLPVAYFIQTMNDFKNDLRKSGEPKKANTNAMIQIAKALSPEEIKQAAEYFGSMKWTPWITVKETATVPVTRSQGGMWIPVEPAATEPIGMRVIETPENVEHTEQFRDDGDRKWFCIVCDEVEASFLGLLARSAVQQLSCNLLDHRAHSFNPSSCECLGNMRA